MSIKQTDIGGDDISKQIYHLKLKTDQLRLENQELRIEREALYSGLNPSLSLGFLINLVSKMLWQRGTDKFRKISANIFGMRANNRHSPDLLKYNSQRNGKLYPYQVNILHTTQNNRPRVLHVIANFYTGGSSRLVVDLIEHLGHRFEQDIITRDIPPEPAYVGLAVYQYEQFDQPDQALSVLKSFRPDFIHVHYLGHHRNSYSELDWKWYSCIFQSAREYNCRIIENINIPTDPYVSNLVSYYVYVSNYVCNEFGHSNARNTTIYPGSDLAFFSRRNKPEPPQDCIGMVYRLEGDKLNEQSIDVFIKVVLRRPGTRALIIGGGHFLELYQNKVKQAGLSESFTFTGYVSYELLPAYFEQMSLFVAPVHTESFGQVTSFAMGMQIPVVGYNVGALKEIIGDSRFLAPPGDSDTLAGIIIDLLDDHEKRLQTGINNLQKVQKTFSVDSMISGYSKLYEEMLKFPKDDRSNA